MTIKAHPQDVSIDQNSLPNLLGRTPIVPDASFLEALAVLLRRERRQEDRGPESLEDATWEDAAFY